MTTRTRDLSAVSINPRDDGSFGVLGSDGETVYTVRLEAERNRCTCPAGQNERHCYHVAAVCLQQARPGGVLPADSTISRLPVIIPGADIPDAVRMQPYLDIVDQVRASQHGANDGAGHMRHGWSMADTRDCADQRQRADVERYGGKDDVNARLVYAQAYERGYRATNTLPPGSDRNLEAR